MNDRLAELQDQIDDLEAHVHALSTAMEWNINHSVCHGDTCVTWWSYTQGASMRSRVTGPALADCNNDVVIPVIIDGKPGWVSLSYVDIVDDRKA